MNSLISSSILICLYIQPYYDPITKEYINIITTNRMPTGNLKNHIKYLKPTSTFPQSNYINSLRLTNITNSCGCMAITDSIMDTTNTTNTTNINNLLTINDIDLLVSFLIENQYTINKDITKIMNNDRIYVNNGKKVLFYVQCPNI